MLIFQNAEVQEEPFILISSVIGGEKALFEISTSSKIFFRFNTHAVKGPLHTSFTTYSGFLYHELFQLQLSSITISVCLSPVFWNMMYWLCSNVEVKFQPPQREKDWLSVHWWEAYWGLSSWSWCLHRQKHVKSGLVTKVAYSHLYHTKSSKYCS